MNKVFEFSLLPDDKINKIESIISKYNGELCLNIKDADLIIVENIPLPIY